MTALAGLLVGSANVEAGGCPCDADIAQPFGVIDFTDIVTIVRCADGSLLGPPCANADINCDGTIDFCDVGAAVAQFQGIADSCALPCHACCGVDVGAPPISCIDTTVQACDLFAGEFHPGISCAGDNPCDCNTNGIEDWLDIQNATSDDCNGNGIPDECEGDCNANGQPDDCDVDPTDPDGNGQVSANCNGNSLPDECEPGACCFTAEAGVCVGGPNDGRACTAADECPDGTCAVSVVQSCAIEMQDICEAPPVNGVFLGVCTQCPEQNAAIIQEGDGSIFIHIVGPPVDCPPPGGRPAARGGCAGPPYIDPWVTATTGSLCHNFGSPETVPIPADFFGPGSDPFDQPVCLEGEPLGPTVWGDFGDADTLVRRSADPFDRCELPSPDERSVPIEIVALSLVSIDPITVTYNGGQNPEQWDVAVDLSQNPQVVGSLTATKAHCNGGHYNSVLPVQPRFTFTDVSSPGNVQVLDTGLAGLPPVDLQQNTGGPWVHDVDPFMGAVIDPCSDFHPAIEDVEPVVDCDCNANAVRDKCDIESTQSADCNNNTVPDECDIALDPSLDQNDNGTIDACEQTAPAPLVPVDGGNRYIRVEAPVSGIAAAGVLEYIRVTPIGKCTITGLDCIGDAHCAAPTDCRLGDYDYPEGPLYVGPPFQAPEEDTSQPGLTFTAAPLAGEAETHDFAKQPQPIAIYGAEIIPEITYEVQRASAGAVLTNPTSWSPPVLVTTRKFGDVAPLFDAPGNPPQPDFNDIAGVVLKFQAAPGAPKKYVCQLQPNVVFPMRPIDFNDIATDVAAFTGTAYSSLFFGPCPIPSTETCNTTACVNDLMCGTDRFCIGGFCRDKCGRCKP